MPTTLERPAASDLHLRCLKPVPEVEAVVPQAVMASLVWRREPLQPSVELSGGLMADEAILTVQGPLGQRIDLGAGEGMSFGTCPCKVCEVAIRIPGSLGQWTMGAVRVFRDHWRLDNLSTDAELVSSDLEDVNQTVRIPPGRVDVVVPFELALVGYADHPDDQKLTIFGHEPRTVPARPCPAAAHVLVGQRLDPTARYMAVLEELCRLDCDSAGLPSSAQIATSLRRRGVNTSDRAVDRQIDYLFRRFFPDECQAEGRRAGWKRRAVANVGIMALRSGPAP